MDAVYYIRPGENEELRYSLRSLVNMEHDRVWVFGSDPGWLSSEVCHVAIEQTGGRYENGHALVTAIASHPEVSDPFILMNDDYLILRPAEPHWTHIGTCRAVADRSSGVWSESMRKTAAMLEGVGITDPRCFEGHTPRPVRKRELLACLMTPPGTQYMTLYGNLFHSDAPRGENAKKSALPDDIDTRTWLSTDEATFAEFLPTLEKLFSEPSPYEEQTMKVECTHPFLDRKAAVHRKLGEVFEVTPERYVEIANVTKWGVLVVPVAPKTADIKAVLAARGIEIPKNARKAELEALLEEPEAEADLEALLPE